MHTILVRFLFLLFKIWLGSVRVDRKKIKQVFDQLEGESAIVTFWHGNLIGVAFAFDKETRKKSVAMTSRSKDGQLIADLLEMNGLSTVRGSANRKGKDKGGAQAFLQSMRVLRQKDRLMCIVPDGSVGPPCQAQPGVVALSAKAKKVVIPINIHFKRYFRLSTWDKLKFPFPFTSAEIVFGKSIAYTEDDLSSEENLNRAKKGLEQELNSLE